MLNRTFSSLVALVLLLAVYVAAAEPATQAPTRMETIELEGMPEEVVTTQYTHDGWFTLWYDAASFAPSPIQSGVEFTLLNNMLNKPVSLKVVAVEDIAEMGGLYLEGERRTAEMEGWTVREADAQGMFPQIGEGAQVSGFLGSREDELLRVYLLSMNGREVLATLRFPLEAEEGWGARMHHMLNSLEIIPQT